MTDRIYLVSDDDTLRPMDAKPYAREDLLQRLLERYPDLLAGEQVDPDDPRRWLLVKREAPIVHKGEESHRWRLDHLFLDQDGVPTLVETKIASNPELRRQVVGQMLDYAANIIESWSPERIQGEFEARCSEAARHPAEALDAHLGSDLLPTEDRIEDFWTKVKTNLEAGRIRLVFVADQIPSSLLRIVEFLNGQMDPCEVLAVELRQYVHEAPGETVRTLVPRVHGVTATARHRKQIKRKIDDPGIYILEPVADTFQQAFGMNPRRRMHRVGWLHMDHPDGFGSGEWLIYQSRSSNSLSISLGSHRYPLDESTQQKIIAALEELPIPEGVEIVGSTDHDNLRYVNLTVAGFRYDDDSNWDELRTLLQKSMALFLQAVEKAQAIRRQ